MPKILAIDDISDNLISLKAIVHDAFPGSSVFTALNGPDGIELAIANNPDVILLDVIMPGMDGFEVCRHLKLDERVRDIPVVFLTALKGDKENRIKALEVGAEGFLSKPIDETELIAQIRAMVKIKVANEQKRSEKERLKWLIEERTLELAKELEERKRAESELKESEERFKLIFEASNVPQSITLPSGELNVNQAFCDVFGFTREELNGKKWKDITLPEEIEIDQKLIDQVLKGEKNGARRIKQYVHKTGSILWGDVSYALIRDHDGNPLHFISTIIDITERKLAEETMREMNARHAALIANIGDVIGIIRADEIITYKSPNIETYFGWKPEDLIGKNVWITVHPDDLEQTRTVFYNLLENDDASAIIEFRYKCKDGSYKWVELNAVNQVRTPNINGILLNYHDITKRKQIEDALIESELFFKESQRAAFIGSYKFNLQSDIWTSSEILDQIFGIDRNYPHSLQGWLEILHPDDREMMAHYFSEEVLAKRNSFNKEYRITRQSDGETRWVLGLGKLKCDAEDRIIEMQGTIQDITERRQADETLRESEEKYRRMVDLLPDAIIIHAEGKIVFANAATYKHMGASSADQIIGKQAIDFIHPDDRNNALARIKNIFDTGEPSGFAIERFKTLNNEFLDTEVIGIPVSYKGKPAVQVILRNITERLRTEEAIRKSESMLRTLIESAPFEVWARDKNGYGILENKNQVRHFGSIIGKTPDHEGIPPDVSQIWVSNNKRVMNGEIVNDECVYLVDGVERHFHQILAPIIVDGAIEGITGFNIDITQRKQAEDALNESNKFNYLLLQTIPFGMDIVDENGTVLFHNDTFQKLFGKSAIGLKCWDLYRDDKQQCADCPLLREITIGETSLYESHGVLGGKVFEINHTGMIFKGKKAMLEIFQDITERKESELALKKSEDRYRSFISQVSEGVYRLECDEPMALDLSVEEQMDYISHHMILTECNDAFVNMYGAGSQNELIGKAHPLFYGDLTKPMNQEALRNFIENGYRAENAKTEEVRFSSQKQYFSNNSIGIIENNHLVRIWGTQTDITEKVKADQLQQILYSISNAALSSVSLTELIEIISIEIGRLLDSTNFYIAFFDEKTNMLSTIYEKDEKDVLDTWPAEKSITGYVVKNQKSLFVSDSQMEELVRSGEIELFGTLSKIWLGVPLMMDKKAIGAVVVQSYDNPEAYTEKDKQILEFVSHQISIAIERKRAEQKLKLLDRAIDQSSVSIVITNKDGLIEYTNPKFTETSGYWPEEVMGKSPRFLRSGKHNAKFYGELWNTLLNGKAWNGEICNKRKNGTLYWENVYISPVEGENGKISHYVGVKEDISEKRLLEKTQRITMEISKISINKTNLNSLLKEVHQKLNDLMHADNFYVALYDNFTDTYTLVYHVDEFDTIEIEQPIKLSNGYTDLVRKTGVGQLIAGGVVHHPELTDPVIEYGEAPSAWLGVPLKASTESEVIGVIAVQDYHNLNAYSKLELHTLEVIAKDICIFIERIRNLEDLTKAKERAEESDRLKTAFLANMSHEIRTPLNSIVGFSDLLLDPDFDREQYADFARIISNSGNSLLSIISDIMDISKIEAGQIKVYKTNFSVAQLIRQIHKQHSFVANEKGLELKMLVENGLETLVIDSDENRIRQVLVNFVGNALKFTTQGYVEIGARVQGNAIRFYVSDTGIGIPPEFHAEIFERFRQVEDADTRKYGGNGLGLAISKSLVELLGGEIGIESEQGKGSTFYFTVPVH